MWVNSTERLPEKDGEYVYQSVYGGVSTILYTVEGGWNTHIEIGTGKLCDQYAMENDGYIARWFDVPTPDPIPKEWVKEYEGATK